MQRAYPKNDFKYTINPLAEFDFSEKECLIKLGENELLLEYHEPKMKQSIEQLLTEAKFNKKDSEINMVVDVLNQQEVIFKTPKFTL